MSTGNWFDMFTNNLTDEATYLADNLIKATKTICDVIILKSSIAINNISEYISDEDDD